MTTLGLMRLNDLPEVIYQRVLRLETSGLFTPGTVGAEMRQGLDSSEPRVRAEWEHIAEGFPRGQTGWKDSLQGIEWGNRMITVVCEVCKSIFWLASG